MDPWPCSVGYGSGVAMGCGMGCRHGLDLALLCLWCRPAAVVPIRPLAWDPPYALKRQKTKRQKKKKKKKKRKKKKHNVKEERKATEFEAH